MQTYRVQEISRNQNFFVALIASSNICIDTIKPSSIKTFYGSIQPSWVVIGFPQKPIAINMQAEKVAIEELYGIIPGLKKYCQGDLQA